MISAFNLWLEVPGERPRTIGATALITRLFRESLPHDGTIITDRNVRWTVKEWARAVRHPLKADGLPAESTDVRRNVPAWVTYQRHVSSRYEVLRARSHRSAEVVREPRFGTPHATHVIRPDLVLREKRRDLEVADSKLAYPLRREDVLQIFAYCLLLKVPGIIAFPPDSWESDDVHAMRNALKIRAWRVPVPAALSTLRG